MDENELTKRAARNNSANPFIRYNRIEVVDVRRDRAVLQLTIGPDSLNLYGFVHGGAIYAMADNAAGCAVSTDGRTYVTQSSNMHFFRNRSEGTVRAEATIRHRGASTCLAMVDITAEDGTLLAEGEFSFFCIDRDRLMKKTGGPAGSSPET